MNYAYIRVSTDAQSGSSQEFEIRNWCAKEGIVIDRWVRETISGTVDASRRKLGQTIKKMHKGDCIICTEISRLGRNMLMIMSILNDCAAVGISIRTVKDRFELTGELNSKIIAFAFALSAEIERNLISQRTTEALADLKASGVKLGRPAGMSRKQVEFEKKRTEIEAMLAKGMSVTAVAKTNNLHRNTLRKYLKENK